MQTLKVQHPGAAAAVLGLGEPALEAVALAVPAVTPALEMEALEEAAPVLGECDVCSVVWWRSGTAGSCLQDHTSSFR